MSPLALHKYHLTNKPIFQEYLIFKTYLLLKLADNFISSDVIGYEEKKSFFLNFDCMIKNFNISPKYIFINFIEFNVL